eukprot:c21497_g1_i1 orf=714-2057(-)
MAFCASTRLSSSHRLICGSPRPTLSTPRSISMDPIGATLCNLPSVSFPNLPIVRHKQGYWSVIGKRDHLQDKLICSLFVVRRIRAHYGDLKKKHLTSEKGTQEQRMVNLSTRSGHFTVLAAARPVNNEQAFPVESVPADADTVLETLTGWLDAFCRFSRPHTIIGTVVGIISVSLLAIQSLSDFSSAFSVGLIQALIPALCMNIYIVGLNQIYDIDIDKVNKPYLPLASGEYSLTTGIAIVTISAVLSLGMGILIGSRPLLWALSISFVLGTAYSTELPFLRWKRSAVAAAGCILCVRAFVVQLAFYLHMQEFVFGRAAALTRPVLFATTFMCFFSVVIALFKDIPDVEGDQLYGIQSFSVAIGQYQVYWLCIYLLEVAYGVAMVVGITSQVPWRRFIMVIGHAVLAIVLWLGARRTDFKSKAAMTSFYMFVWKLFYAEYLLIPLMG